jgi:hypothetical protein
LDLFILVVLAIGWTGVVDSGTGSETGCIDFGFISSTKALNLDRKTSGFVVEE